MIPNTFIEYFCCSCGVLGAGIWLLAAIETRKRINRLEERILEMQKREEALRAMEARTLWKRN
jgi:hypothetical protein